MCIYVRVCVYESKDTYRNTACLVCHPSTDVQRIASYRPHPVSFTSLIPYCWPPPSHCPIVNLHHPFTSIQSQPLHILWHRQWVLIHGFHHWFSIASSLVMTSSPITPPLIFIKLWGYMVHNVLKLGLLGQGRDGSPQSLFKACRLT